MDEVMDAELALNWLDSLILDRTGHRLNDLQRQILIQVWQGQKYFEIAVNYGCTEGHAKDVGSQLWRSLSDILGEKITKQNCRSVTERCLRKARSLKRKIGNRIEQWGSGTSDDADPWVLEESRDLVFTEPRDLLQAPNFVGRGEAIAHLSDLKHRGYPLVVIQGEGGLGKTTLAQQFLTSQAVELVLELFIAKDSQHITPVEQVVEEWLKQDLDDEAGVDFGISLSRLKRHLRSRPIGILIDNLEPALDSAGCFIPAHRGYAELLCLLGDNLLQSVTLVTSRDRLCEPGVNLTHYRLPGLSEDAWATFFSYHNIPLCTDTLQAMHHAYGGNAKAMGLLCGVIQEDFGRNMQAYWQLHHADLLVAPDLHNLVSSQVDRLNALNPVAYQLFCRLGCYRYQTISYLSADAVLAMLWDVPQSLQNRVLTALKNRSLLECQNGRYSLHPAVQTEAIARLQSSPDWQQAHRTAAAFWTNQTQRIENRQDAIQAFEAYYHHIAIDEYKAAAQVILRSRVNQWNQFLPLGSTLYRFGLVHPVFEAIAQVTKQLKSQQSYTPQLGELYNIWGDLHWIMGRVQDAIACQQETIQIATQQLQLTHEESLDELSLPGAQELAADHQIYYCHQIYYLKMLKVDSSLSLGLYYIDLWELEMAAAQFEQVICQSQYTRHHAWAEKAMVCLALVKSYEGDRSSALALAHQVAEKLLERGEDSMGRVAYFLQILGHAYGSLGEVKQASTMLNRALSVAESGHYLQIQGRSLASLGAIARYQKDHSAAITHLRAAIQCLEKLGAACDLAEAHLQTGLTYQQMSYRDDAVFHLQQASTLFQTMAAPKQVQRVLNLAKK